MCEVYTNDHKHIENPSDNEDARRYLLYEMVLGLLIKIGIEGIRRELAIGKAVLIEASVIGEGLVWVGLRGTQVAIFSDGFKSNGLQACIRHGQGFACRTPLLERKRGVIAIVIGREGIVLFSRNGGSRQIIIPRSIRIARFAIDDV